MLRLQLLLGAGLWVQQPTVSWWVVGLMDVVPHEPQQPTQHSYVNTRPGDGMSA